MRINDYDCKYFKSAVLSSFLADARKYPVPTIEEEESLIMQYKAGDKEAKNKMIIGNLRFIYSLAKIYAKNESEVMDYVNEGVIGLTKAFEKFDPTKGYKFITYGVWYIRRHMNYYMLTKRDMVSRSAQIGNVLKKSEMIRQKYFAEKGMFPTDEEVIEALNKSYNIKVYELDDIREMGISSIDDTVADDFTFENSEEYNTKTAAYNEYESVTDTEYNNSMVSAYLEVLPEKVAKIIRLKFGIGEEREYSSEEIGLMFNIQPERIDAICEAAIFEMRKHRVSVAKKVM